MIHQSKSQYYLGPSQTSMVEFFTEIFGCKPLIVFLKISNLDMTGSIRCFQKHFLFFVSEDFASWKKACNIYTRRLEFTFPRPDGID